MTSNPSRTAAATLAASNKRYASRRGFGVEISFGPDGDTWFAMGDDGPLDGQGAGFPSRAAAWAFAAAAAEAARHEGLEAMALAEIEFADMAGQ